MVGWSDEGWGTKKAGGGGTGVTEYATIAELVTASEGSLAPGYYEVPSDWPGPWATKWDGAVFSPPPPDDFLVSQFLDAYFPASELDAIALGDPVDAWPDVISGASVVAAGTARPSRIKYAGTSGVQGDGANNILKSTDAAIVAMGNTAATEKVAFFSVAALSSESFKYFQNFAADSGIVFLSCYSSSGTFNTNAYFDDAATVTGPVFAPNPAQCVFLVASNGTHIRAYARRREFSSSSELLWTQAITGTRQRTVDYYSICGAFIGGVNRYSTAGIQTHGIATGAKAQALYDDPTAFFNALGKVYGI